jgi:PadR family transcriptional regulator, regulatory protein AphA
VDLRLTPTSYIVLGLLEASGEATPYDLKQAVAASIGNFWTVQHSQLYSEPERLAAAGLLSEDREETGRRRRRYRMTEEGRRALAAWREEVHPEPTELRDQGLLKLFLGAEPAALASGQVPAHRVKLEEYEALRAACPPDAPRGIVLALDAGIAHEREWVRFWEEVGAEGQRATSTGVPMRTRR